MLTSPSIIIELVLGLFLWWIAVYIFTQNPTSRVIQLAFGLLLSVSAFFSGDIFLFVAKATNQPDLYLSVLKSFLWSLYLPMPLLYHLSLLQTVGVKRKFWQTPLLYLGYFSLPVIFVLDINTNLIRNYADFSLVNISPDLAEITGKLFWLVGFYIIPLLAGTAFNFYSKQRQHKKYSFDWYKYFWPAVGAGLSALLGPIIILGYYRIVPYSPLASVTDLVIVILPLVYSIIRYGLFVDEVKVVFGKTFLNSTIMIVLIFLIYSAFFVFTFSDELTVDVLIFPYLLAYFVILSHPVYEWLLTFAHDLTFNASSGFSIITDQEASQALRDYNHQSRLEDSILHRLSLVDRRIQSRLAQTPVDAVQHIIKEAIENLRPLDFEFKRTKSNLKYYLLRMLALDEAEEGQILWELGFEGYPVRVMSAETRERPPLFKMSSPSDYPFISRNAYLALKKEAIHDVAWRISYLEKQLKHR